MSLITPLLLAGGSGSRLWPLSRKSYPKQFSKLLGEESLFQRTAKRFVSSKSLTLTPPLIITNQDFRFIVDEQPRATGINPGAIIIEQKKKNTAPAVLAASIFELGKNQEATILVAPSDHIIKNCEALHAAILKGVPEVSNGNIVTFGVKPTRPETGYGYLELIKKSDEEISKLRRFVEKPNAQKAQEMLATDNFLWNSGIFLFRAKDLVEGFRVHAPELLLSVSHSVKNGKEDLGFWRLNPKDWSETYNISLDFALMEKASNLSVVPFSAGWSDLGSWESVWEQYNTQDGVVTSENEKKKKKKNVFFLHQIKKIYYFFGKENIPKRF